MEEKINYYSIGEEELKKIKALSKKPSILLHVCCGPCSSWPITYLLPYFDITLFFNNSNIYPKSEHDRREDELRRFIAKFNEENHAEIKVIYRPYDNEKYMDDLWVFKDEPERGKRCLLCYEKRIDEAFNFANENNYNYFTTVMSISRQKSSEAMNLIGKNLQNKYQNTKFFFTDFKKKDGILKRNKIVKEYGMYEQNYCGCEISYKNRQKYDAQKAKNEAEKH